MVNRAVLCFNNYRIAASEKPQKNVEMMYNSGRFYAHLKVHTQAIEFLNKAISSADETLSKN